MGYRACFTKLGDTCDWACLQTIAVTVALFTAYLNVIYGVRFTSTQNLHWMRCVLISIATGM